jgi:excinuclease UvrABC nuclease subunit
MNKPRIEERYQPPPDGFQKVLCYRVDADGRMSNHKVLDDDLWKKPNSVYMRVLDDGEVLYVGKCDSMLETRLKSHMKGVFEKELTTDARGERAREYKERVQKHSVTIWAYAPDSICLCGMKVYPHVGLESAMIKKYKPRFTFRQG